MTKKIELGDGDMYPQAKIDIVYMDNYCGGEENKGLEYAHVGDSGFDLRAATPRDYMDNHFVGPHEVRIIPTGVQMSIPRGFELQVRTRSGTPLKRGFMVANSPGTVDSCYRGEIGVVVRNLTSETIMIKPGERLAQGVICPVIQALFNVVDELDRTERGSGAYNSTGTK